LEESELIGVEPNELDVALINDTGGSEVGLPEGTVVERDATIEIEAVVLFAEF